MKKVCIWCRLFLLPFYQEKWQNEGVTFAFKLFSLITFLMNVTRKWIPFISFYKCTPFGIIFFFIHLLFYLTFRVACCGFVKVLTSEFVICNRKFYLITQKKCNAKCFFFVTEKYQVNSNWLICLWKETI